MDPMLLSLLALQQRAQQSTAPLQPQPAAMSQLLAQLSPEQQLSLLQGRLQQESSTQRIAGRDPPARQASAPESALAAAAPASASASVPAPAAGPATTASSAVTSSNVARDQSQASTAASAATRPSEDAEEKSDDDDDDDNDNEEASSTSSGAEQGEEESQSERAEDSQSEQAAEESEAQDQQQPAERNEQSPSPEQEEQSHRLGSMLQEPARARAPPFDPTTTALANGLSVPVLTALQQLGQPALHPLQAQAMALAPVHPFLQGRQLLTPLQIAQRQAAAEALAGNAVLNSLASSSLPNPAVAALVSQLRQQPPQQVTGLVGTAAVSAARAASAGATAPAVAEVTRAAAAAAPQPDPQQRKPAAVQASASAQQQQQQQQSTKPPARRPPPLPTSQSMPKKPRAKKTSAAAKKSSDDQADGGGTHDPKDEITNPGEHDVLLGRGSGASNHLGNIRYRMLVNEYKPKYINATRVDKPKVADEVVQIWRNLNPPGRFLTRCDGDNNEAQDDDDFTTGRWVDVGNARAKTKTCQCLREKDRPPSSKRVKKGG